ncbi:mitochondrial thiamine pyrophosphate carrier-like isoform X2 [Amphibalanus amphitrite]|uniref:mitochondrial thiamine pyrophosphate carrier-like isoform X2 n=1 Tax=Amphibalanus amphitrite TaxID=1232801 RepID=UPI001C909C74|nr:mitochondrial thiamine pyrophosphate carrier-like isoform X2 [Amphibalanus amphitrite]XP_043195408.1 mitochondrial thiamine pyrophosphate carrier-like isoform X2 [Amphibalanus amphitrite]
MVGYDPSMVQLSSWQHAQAGAVSSFLTRLCCQPLDVLKIRFQLQHEPVTRAAGSKYYGMWQAVSAIVREEGVLALWKGHVPAQLLSVLYGTVQFASFEILSREMHHLTSEPSSEPGVKLHFVCGALAGVAATITTLPLDVVRTRLVAQGEPKFYRGMSHAAWHMLRHEGPTAFAKGLVPTMLQTAPYTSLQFGAFEVVSRLAGSWHILEDRPSTRAMLSGVAAGLVAKTAVYPLDVVKKRLQIQGFQRSGFGESRVYSGLLDCLWSTARREGVRGIYKGLLPSSVKAMATTGLHFTFYELAIRLMRSMAAGAYDG